MWCEHTTVAITDDDGSVSGFCGISRNIDEQVASETARAASEHEYRVLAENASDVVVQGTLTGQLKWVSPSIERLLGWPAEQVIGRRIHELIHDDDLVELEAARAVLERGESAHLEARFRTKAGDFRWVSVAVNPMFDEHGAVVGRIGGWRDVDAEHRARDELARNEAQLRMVLENATDVAVHTVEGVAVWVSDNVEALLGWRADELVGKPTAGLWHPDDLPSGVRLREASYDGRASRATLRMVRRDGEVISVEVATRPVIGHDGRRGAVALVHDVTDQVRVDAELAEARARDRLMAEFASDVLCVMQPDFTIEWVTGATEELLGWSADELVGRSKWDLFVEDDGGVFEKRSRALTHGEVVRGLARMRRADGTVRWVDRRTRGIFAPDGSVQSFVSRWRDAQAEVEYLEALTEAAHEARDLAVQYEEARRDAVSASAAKTSFLSRMSHELRTPLNAVLGFAQLLGMDDLDDDQQAAVQQIVRGGRHLLELINEVLDIARIESGRMTLSPEAVLAADVIGEALELIGPLAAQHEVIVTPFDPSRCNVYVFVDRQRLIQILLNLLSNAVKYNRPDGHVSVRCTAIGDEVGFEVVDDGIGIATELLPRLFAPFDRLGAETSNTEGTGIGLALSRALAEIMQGRITVSSSPGVGSVFTVVVRRSDAEQHTSVGGDDAVVVTLAPRATRVLYVEDNPTNAALMHSIVRRRDSVVLEVAVDGASGLQRALTWLPDLVLLDLHLPDIAGEELLRRLRADPRTATLPIVVVTAAATHDVRDLVAALGADGYLAKPVDVQQVLAWIDDPHQGRV